MTHRANAIDRHVAARLCTARTDRGLTVRQASAALGLRVNSVHSYEKNLSRCPPGRLLPLARLYRKPIQWFFKRAPK